MNAAASDDGPSLPGPGFETRATLLVVEDDVLARFAVSGTLRDAGYAVLEAASADEAASVLQTVAVDLLFVDVHLHGEGDGLSVIRFARAHRPWVKIVLTSGKVAPDTIPELDGLGPFIAKPYLFSRVIHLIRRTLAGEEGPGPDEGAAP